MFTNPLSRELLAPYFDPKYTQKQLVRLASLPASLHHLGQVLVEAQKRGETLTAETQQRRLQKALEDLARLSPADRQHLFLALAPSIASEIEAGWQVFDSLPYTLGYIRRPFRYREPQTCVEARLVRSRWVLELLQLIQGYEQPVTWLATRAAYLGWGAPQVLGKLFAGAMDLGGPTGQEVFDILTASARGDHPTAKMGRHVVHGLLCASRTDGWEFVARLLLAAQREEGLRQVIMEAVDEAHPDAFRRMLQVVVGQNLVRFSAVVRAAAVWVGLPFEAANPKAVLEIITHLQGLLDDPLAQQTTLQRGSPEEQYLALWSMAYTDVLQAIAAAQPLLHHPQAEQRFVGVYFLSQTQLSEGEQLLLPMLDDPDLRVAVCAYSGAGSGGAMQIWYLENDLFERLERLVQRLPAQTKTLKPIVWDWMTLQVDRQAIAGMLPGVLGKRSPARLLPYLSGMYAYARLNAARLFVKHVHEDPNYRKALLALAGDRDGYVHENIFPLLEKIRPRPDEIQQLEGLLTRKTSGVRRGVIGILLRQSDGDLLDSIDRLLARRDAQQHQAGVELLREMALAGRRRETCQNRAAQLRQAGLSEAEQHILADLLVDETVTYSLENALGLADQSRLSRPLKPQPKKASMLGLRKGLRLGSPAAANCIQALDELVGGHRTEPVEINYWQNDTREALLGDVHFGLPQPDPNRSLEENRQRLPLAEVWEQWWRERPKPLRDEDGHELLRALAALSLLTTERTSTGWVQVVPKELRTYLDEAYDLRLNYEWMVHYVLDWLVYLHPEPDATPFLLDAVEATCHRIGQQIRKGSEAILQISFQDRKRWDIQPNRTGYIDLARRYRYLHSQAWLPAQHTRFWGLLKWLEQTAWQNSGSFQPELEDVLLAHSAGAASLDDLYLYLLGEREKSFSVGSILQSLGILRYAYNRRSNFADLSAFSGKRPHPIFAQFPVLQQAIEECRQRILEVELKRGDLPSAASKPAQALRSVPGMHNLVRLLAALGKAGFDRSRYSSDQDRSAVFSHLIRVSHPLEADTPEAFAGLVGAARIPERRLVEMAVYAPQWARFVEHALGWPGMAEGVWWVYAHTKDRQWSVEVEIRADWVAQISEYTPLTADELMDGAVDVAWFKRMFAILGEAHWQEVYRAASYAASGTGHARARLFADAMLGNTPAHDLVARIQTKRNQDALRALGLVPLPEDDTRPAEILRRYELMQDFLRTSKQFGSQRQASEKLATAIALENLARTAGFSDPQRLEWAMELQAVADLAQGPVTVQVEDVRVTLAVDSLGEASLSSQRGEKALKNIPPAVKKNEQVAELVRRKAALEQQARRMRLSLENAMVRGDEFTAQEVSGLFAHPILRVMLEQLIFTGPAGMGYPVQGQAQKLALEGLSQTIPLSPDAPLRIAHPYDLLQSGCWHDWQHECFVRERIQPFKQVFRELYILTQTEQDEKNFSRRYAGQQVGPRQALALFGNRGWVTSPEEGVLKTFHAEGMVARVGFLQVVYTPAEVEGLTIEAVGFTRRGQWLSIPLEQVPPRLFSEVMRDLDLVVSVAHAGGVDPEASASTVESRAALVRETCELLQLDNVRVENRYALIDGKLGNYTLHLSSGTVHKQPGGALCIIPVHSQHRGRLFLPFVDNDPKTAEIISKVLLLAKDQAIKDPTILEQIL